MPTICRATSLGSYSLLIFTSGLEMRGSDKLLQVQDLHQEWNQQEEEHAEMGLLPDFAGLRRQQGK
jgi:hypothetical protein